MVQMTITVKPKSALIAIALLGVLVGMAVSQVAGAVGSSRSAPTAHASSLYPVIRQLQQINATLGSAPGGSIAPVLRNIETYTYRTCLAVEGHPYGHCQ